MEHRDIVVDVWGRLACFTNPFSKIERVTYPVITPSAARGILCAIYAKPNEFFYEIRQIDVMNPVQYTGAVINEIKSKTDASKLSPIVIGEHTQRRTTFLQDVYYRIHARIWQRPDFRSDREDITSFVAQFNRRVENGQCFEQPCLGLKSCIAFFGPKDSSRQPLTLLNMQVGAMLYDVFDISKNVVLDTRKKTNNVDTVRNISFFTAEVKGGVMRVPHFSSPEIHKTRDVDVSTAVQQEGEHD